MGKENNVKDFFVDLADTIRRKVGDKVDENLVDIIDDIPRYKPKNMATIIENNIKKEFFGGFFEDVVCVDGTGINAIEKITVYKECGTIKEGAYKNLKNLKTVEIEDGVTEVGKDAFRECSSIEAITFPQSVWSIQSGAFFVTLGKGNLKTVKFEGNEDGVVIKSQAFQLCYNLQTVYIENVKTIEGLAFQVLQKLYLNNDSVGGVTISPSAFSGNLPTIYVRDELVENWRALINSSFEEGKRPTIKGFSEEINNQ